MRLVRAFIFYLALILILVPTVSKGETAPMVLNKPSFKLTLPPTLSIKDFSAWVQMGTYQQVLGQGAYNEGFHPVSDAIVCLVVWLYGKCKFQPMFLEGRTKLELISDLPRNLKLDEATQTFTLDDPVISNPGNTGEFYAYRLHISYQGKPWRRFELINNPTTRGFRDLEIVDVGIHDEGAFNTFYDRITVNGVHTRDLNLPFDIPVEFGTSFQGVYEPKPYPENDDPRFIVEQDVSDPTNVGIDPLPVANIAREIFAVSYPDKKSPRKNVATLGNRYAFATVDTASIGTAVTMYLGKSGSTAIDYQKIKVENGMIDRYLRQSLALKTDVLLNQIKPLDAEHVELYNLFRDTQEENSLYAAKKIDSISNAAKRLIAIIYVNTCTERQGCFYYITRRAAAREVAYDFKYWDHNSKEKWKVLNEADALKIFEGMSD